jgi:biopolymer transport protein ExbB
MVVAIPALMFHRYFRGRIAGYIVDMEHEAIQLLDTLDAAGNDSHSAASQVAPGARGITPPMGAS